MVVLIAGNPETVKLANFRFDSKAEVIIVDSPTMFNIYKQADVYLYMNFDGTFYGNKEVPALINETVKTFEELTDLPEKTARFCGWNTFVEREFWEISINSEKNEWINFIMSSIGKTFAIVPDIRGLVTPRIISAIINEAYYLKASDIADDTSVNTAMKLGTNYPYGPIEWSDKIGKSNVYNLLISLSEKEDMKYDPCSLLKEGEGN
ncbi:3-hydroxyacyl-CoA dehydrogenase family protein [Polluticaenibacter yanchengensis]|uniref:3-hydroxyacyl-CoA dehydrogenase family protein n=1 Tax=Polluticaenibacter yanchengensis TaxID=3014562 RepID=A0ABT4UK08_9BACT|nr:3-hydroxyacyl-CoA dehydrogenase family protein [Chitinophagaceae bacterium LY-5]